jgi:hypothetical protein
MTGIHRKCISHPNPEGIFEPQVKHFVDMQEISNLLNYNLNFSKMTRNYEIINNFNNSFLVKTNPFFTDIM